MPIHTAVILAGGLGTRLRPVTYEIPKALIPIQGKTLTEHVIGNLRKAGIKKAYLSIGYMSDRIIDFFKSKDLGIELDFLVETEPLGTGGWMHTLTPKQRQDFNEDFIVVNGDDLFELDWDKMHAQHKQTRALITIALVEIEDTSKYGVAELEGNKIKRFVEKPSPDKAPSHYVSGGQYIYSKEVFSELPSQARFMNETELFPLLAAKGRLFAFFDEDVNWMTTNSFEQWEHAINNWKKRK
jgi:mannose-1-phosphate guanylyltransferase